MQVGVVMSPYILLVALENRAENLSDISVA
jgi:hypothetical protein